MKRYQNFQCKHYAPLWDDLYFSFSFFFFSFFCTQQPGKSAATFPLIAKQVQRVNGRDVGEMCKLNQIQRHYRTRLFLCSFAWMETLPAKLTARSEPRWLLLWRHVMRHHSMSRAEVQPEKKKPNFKWKILRFSFSEVHKRIYAWRRTREPPLMAILISFSKYQRGFVLYNDSERGPPTSRIHTSAHAAIFRVTQY